MTNKEPFPFKRGATFSVAMSLPETVPVGYFKDWTPKVQIRKASNDSDAGFISELIFAWADVDTSRQFTITDENTDDWPVGLAEVDVLFTHPTNGKTARTKTAIFYIKRGITKNG